MGKIIPLKTPGFRARLREAASAGELVRVWRGNLEHGSFCGYVAGIGREYFLLSVVGDTLGFDGLYAMRHRDLTELEAPEEHAGFITRALQLRGVQIPRPQDFPLDDIVQVVQAASGHAPVIGVHVDSEEESEVCYIGRLLGLEDDGFNMQEVSPDAEWLTEPSFFAWSEVSTVSFREPYGLALAEVAGAVPALKLDGPDVGRVH